MKVTGVLLPIFVIAGSAQMGSVLGSDIYVDPDHTGSQAGSQSDPFVDLWRADQHAESGDTIHLISNMYEENMTFAKPMTITSTGGVSRIGSPGWIPTTIGAYLYGVVWKPGSDWVATPGFESYVNWTGGLEAEKLRYVMLAPLWMPPREQVKYVFLFSSGQQQFVCRGCAGSGQPQITTGAKDDWAWDFPEDQERVYRQISMNSIATWLIEETPLHDYGPHNTLLILAFKGGLQGPQEPVGDGFDFTDRYSIIEGYWGYLNEKADFQNVDTVYLCGISRGGALASRLGKRIRRDYAEPEIYISTIDGHVIPDTREMLSTNSAVLNPLTAPPEEHDRHAWYTEIGSYYKLVGLDENPVEPFEFDDARTNGLHVFNTVTSVKDILVNEQFRTYCSGDNLGTADEEYGADLRLENPLLWGWFRQRWVNYDHQHICENWESDVGPEHVSWFLTNAF